MSGLESAHRGRPVQVAKRKQKPLGQEETLVRKKSKTKAATAEDGETSNALDDQEEPRVFISPEKFLDKPRVRDGDEESRLFVCPLKYMYCTNEDNKRPPAGDKSYRKGKGDKEPSTQPSDNKPSSNQHPPHVEKSTEPPVDRFVTNAQEDLIRMIEEGASDKTIENQTKIIRMLQARLLSRGESIVSIVKLLC
jgi:hypothetical protein